MTIPLRVARRPFAAIAGRSRDWLLPSRAMPHRLWLPAIGVTYVVLIGALGGLHAGNVALGALCVLDAYNPNLRRFLRVFWPVISAGALYASLRFYLDAATTGRVHVAEPYLLDRAWFGTGTHTLNEVFATHHWVIADFAAGFAYLIYVVEYLALAMLAYFAGRETRARSFALGFLIVNAMGFVTY